MWLRRSRAKPSISWGRLILADAARRRKVNGVYLAHPSACTLRTQKTVATSVANNIHECISKQVSEPQWNVQQNSTNETTRCLSAPVHAHGPRSRASETSDTWQWLRRVQRPSLMTTNAESKTDVAHDWPLSGFLPCKSDRTQKVTGKRRTEQVDRPCLYSITLMRIVSTAPQRIWQLDCLECSRGNYIAPIERNDPEKQ